MNGEDDEDKDKTAKIIEMQINASDSASDSSDSDDEDDEVGKCDGNNCNKTFEMWDDTWWCRYCGDVFCHKCRQRIVNSSMDLKICSPKHVNDFFHVPILTQRFKKGEIPVGDKVMKIEEWKAGIRKQWGL